MYTGLLILGTSSWMRPPYLIAQLCLRDYELLARSRDFDAIGKAFPLTRVPTRLLVHDPGASCGAKPIAIAQTDA